MEMKSIGLSIEVYELLMMVKHQLEKSSGEIVSYDKVIRKLIGIYGEDKGNERNNNQPIK